MTRMTITEALAEIKTIGKRLEKRRNGIADYLVRQERFRDPLEKTGGSRAFVAAERQGIGDLEERIVAIRRAIQAANMVEMLSVKGVSRPIQDWLTWKREVAPQRQAFLAALRKGIVNMRGEAVKKGLAVTVEGTGKPDDVIVNIDEADLARQIEEMEEILGTLDGQLSLKNATVFVDVT